MRLAPAVALFCLPAVLASEMAWAAAAGPPGRSFLAKLGGGTGRRAHPRSIVPRGNASSRCISLPSRGACCPTPCGAPWTPHRVAMWRSTRWRVPGIRHDRPRWKTCAMPNAATRLRPAEMSTREARASPLCCGRSSTAAVARSRRMAATPTRTWGWSTTRSSGTRPDTVLPKIEASETVWTAYRDAFTRFAITMDRPDAAGTIRAVLDRQRAEDLPIPSREMIRSPPQVPTRGPLCSDARPSLRAVHAGRASDIVNRSRKRPAPARLQVRRLWVP